MNRYFITGIGTDVGKTLISAILTEALEADYWKPIQAGDIGNGDAQKVENLISNTKTIIHPSVYNLQTPASPHYAAQVDGVEIDLTKIIIPETHNDLIIEGAGGLLVPLNHKHTIADLIKKDFKVIVVSRNYLGSINHTLLTLEVMKSRGIKPWAIIFNGEENQSSQDIILQKYPIKSLGRVGLIDTVNKQEVKNWAQLIKPNLY
jgi:dethiobiotin synthetase